jgi:prolyl oligopeptidase
LEEQLQERPDLFAAIPEVGAFNTIRSELSPNGPGNIPEFGTVKDKTEFKRCRNGFVSSY